MRLAKSTKRSATRTDIFYAYPATPPSTGETILTAIQSLQKLPLIKQMNLRFKPWTDMSITGRSIITQITQNIDRADIFACDVTMPNLNVTFELGYAIGRLKRVWISLNTAMEDSRKQFQRLYAGILPAGYASYANYRQLADAMIEDNPWNSLGDLLLSSSYRAAARRPEQPTVLYVKPPIESDAVIAAAEVLGASFFSDGLLIDDPRENPSPTLEWYAEKVHTADAVVVHLLANDQSQSVNHNVKASFVAGLAHAFGKPVRMLAHTPFESPIDYQHLLACHDTAQSCRSYLTAWLDDLESRLPRRRPRRAQVPKEAVLTLDLRSLSIGEPVAEHESATLDEYFVETSNYYLALDSQTLILVGRRGTGKTATLYAVESTLTDDKRNHVCVIKPIGYEMDGLVRLLQERIHAAEQGYLIESLWKYLVYTEMACGVAASITGRPPHQYPTDEETELVNYVESHAGMMSAPFSERLDEAVRSLLGLGDLSQVSQQKARISELLHLHELQDLRTLLGPVLHSRHKVTVLIDNLDEPWRPGHHIDYQALLLSGLLRVATDITDDFRHEDAWRTRVNMSVVIFLRSDIFAYIQPLAVEQDKLPLHRVVWSDEELLLRVVEQRLAHGLPTNFAIADVWRTLFPEEVVGLPTSKFITSTTLKRPRDVIYLVKEAIAGAVNRGHTAVTDEDFLDARRKYSEYVFRSMLAEDDPTRGQLEAVLYEFAGAPRTMLESDVEHRINKAGVEGPDVEFYLNLLCDINFLGIQTADGHRFSEHEGDRQLLREVARRLAHGTGGQSYEINAAFYQVLQIE